MTDAGAIACLRTQRTESSLLAMSPLNALTQLTWLSLSARLDDAQLASLRLGANMMVSLGARCSGIQYSIFTPAIVSVLSKAKRAEPPALVAL